MLIQFYQRYKPTVFSLGKRSAELLFMQFTSALLLFGSNFILVHSAGEKTYGEYVTVITWVNIAAVFVSFGFEDRFIQDIPKQPRLRYGFYRFGLSTILRSALIVSSIFLLLSFFSVLPFSISPLYFIALTVFTSLLSIFAAYRRATNRFAASMVIDRIGRPFGMILLLAVISGYPSKINVETLLGFQIMTAVFIYFSGAALLKKTFKQKSAGNIDRSLKSNFSFCLITLITLLSTRLDIVFLSAHVDASEIGRYNVAARLAEMAAYPLLITNLWLPARLSEKYGACEDDAIMLPVVVKAGLMLSGVLLLCFSGLYIFGPAILNVFGENFSGMHSVTMLLCGLYLCNCFSAPVNALLLVSNRRRYSLISLLISITVTAVSAAILIPAKGTIGAAAAMCTGSAAFALCIIGSFFMSYKTKA